MLIGSSVYAIVTFISMVYAYIYHGQMLATREINAMEKQKLKYYLKNGNARIARIAKICFWSNSVVT